jgi:hypothetical protein
MEQCVITSFLILTNLGEFLFIMAICHDREVKERRGRYIRSGFLCKLLIKLHGLYKCI